jgi:hypothetical protein
VQLCDCGGAPLPQGLPDRMGKHDGAAVQRLAALYGLKCTAQGAGKRLTIMVRSSHHMTRQRILGFYT